MFRIRFSLALAASLTAAAALAQTDRLRAGHDVTAVTPPPGVPFATALAPVPGSPEHVVASMGFFGSQSVRLVDLTDPGSPSYTLLAGGAADLAGGDGQLDSAFGNVGGLAWLGNGDLIIVDNANPFSGGPGNTIFRARDLNGDGDFLDVVAASPEVAPLLGVIPGVGFDFNGAQCEVAPDGTLYVVTSDGFGTGEVIRITDPAGAPAGTIFRGGLDFGGGLAVRDGAVWAGDVDDSFAFARIWRLEDLNSDGDAEDAGEAVVITSSLPNVFDLAFANDGRLHVTSAIDFFSASELVAIDPAAGDPSQPLFRPGSGVVMGDVVPAGEAAPFAPHGAPGQRLLMVGDNFGGTNALFILEPAPAGGLDLQDPLYAVTSVSPAGIGAGEFGGALAVSPVSPELAFAPLGVFGDQQLWRFDLADPAYAGYRLVADGFEDTGADGRLDNGFGNVAGLAVFPTGEVVIVDNSPSFQTLTGDTVFLARDLNGDGDFLDVVAASPEVAPLVGSIPGAVNFAGVQAEIGPDGAVYIVTSDGGDQGEVIRIADPLGTPDATIFYQGGIDFGSGLAWLTGGASPELIIGDVDAAFFPARLRRLIDLNSDGDAMDPGEETTLPNTLPGVYDLAAGPGNTLWATQFGELDEIDPSTGAPVRAFAFPRPTPGFNALADLTFTSLAGEFTPGSASRVSLLTATNDFAGVSFLHVITPSEFSTTPVAGHEVYR